MVDPNELVRLAKLGRKAEQRGKAAQGCLNALLSFVGKTFLVGWLTMLAVGIAHSEWVPGLPTIGYWWSCLLVALTYGLFTGNANTKRPPD